MASSFIVVILGSVLRLPALLTSDAGWWGCRRVSTGPHSLRCQEQFSGRTIPLHAPPSHTHSLPRLTLPTHTRCLGTWDYLSAFLCLYAPSSHGQRIQRLCVSASQVSSLKDIRIKVVFHYHPHSAGVYGTCFAGRCSSSSAIQCRRSLPGSRLEAAACEGCSYKTGAVISPSASCRLLTAQLQYNILGEASCVPCTSHPGTMAIDERAAISLPTLRQLQTLVTALTSPGRAAGQ